MLSHIYKAKYVLILNILICGCSFKDPNRIQLNENNTCRTNLEKNNYPIKNLRLSQTCSFSLSPWKILPILTTLLATRVGSTSLNDNSFLNSSSYLSKRRLLSNNYAKSFYYDNTNIRSVIEIDDRYLAIGSAINDSYAYSYMNTLNINKSGEINWDLSISSSFGNSIGYSGIPFGNSSFIITGNTNQFLSTEQLSISIVNSNGNIEWSKKSQTTDHDYASRIIKTHDNNGLIVGTYSDNTVLIKINTAKEIEYFKSISTSTNDIGIDIIERSYDNNILILGYTPRYGTSPSYASFFLFDNQNIIWQKNLYQTLAIHPVFFVEVENNEFIFGGNVDADPFPKKTAFLGKINSLGDLLWIKSLSASNYEIINNAIVLDNKQIMYIGSTSALNTDGSSILILKTYNNGTIITSLAVDLDGNYYGKDIIQKENLEIIIAANTDNGGIISITNQDLDFDCLESTNINLVETDIYDEFTTFSGPISGSVTLDDLSTSIFSDYTPLQTSGIPIENNLCTLNPTTDPTNNPTTIPTINPSYNPSSTPTINPSYNPSSTPTINPSYNPSVTPTINPSSTPTINPSHNPTPIPTINPSGYPTFYPTRYPSNQPTFNPTLPPSINPSSTPTSYSSFIPTKGPSLYPSSSSISNPSISPTYTPTNFDNTNSQTTLTSSYSTSLQEEMVVTQEGMVDTDTPINEGEIKSTSENTQPESHIITENEDSSKIILYLVIFSVIACLCFGILVVFYIRKQKKKIENGIELGIQMRMKSKSISQNIIDTPKNTVNSQKDSNIESNQNQKNIALESIINKVEINSLEREGYNEGFPVTNDHSDSIIINDLNDDDVDIISDLNEDMQFNKNNFSTPQFPNKLETARSDEKVLLNTIINDIEINNK